MITPAESATLAREVPTLPFFQPRKSGCRWLLPLVLTLAAAGSRAPAQTNTGAGVTGGLGVGIHFIAPRPSEIKALADSGVHWVRKDLDWASTETKPGVYDFSAYDKLLSDLDSAGLHTLFILDYNNPLYDHGLSPATDEARQAFARWAVAAMTHFRGRHILWEIYNEPNFRFWTPHPNTEDYIKLALAVGEAAHESAPDEKLAGPASAEIDLGFLEACFKAGLLNYWSAVSIHTYTSAGPETVANDLLRVRLLMRKYTPAGKVIPAIITEWGYSAVAPGMDEQKQAEMLARGWLTQIAADEPLSFWYDWESGSDPRDFEQHFGLIAPPEKPGGPVTKKLAYEAAQTLTGMLGGFRFNKRLVLEKPEDYVLLFTKGKDVRLAAWTTAAPHQAVLPASPGSFEATGLTGGSLAALMADRHGLQVTLENQPQYLVPDAPNDLLTIAGAWQALPQDIEVRAPGALNLRVPITNPLQKTLRFRARGLNSRLQAGPAERARPGDVAPLLVRLQSVTRSADPVPAAVELDVRGLGRVAQSTMLIAENPLLVTLLPLTPHSLPVLIANPARDGFDGWVGPTRSEGIRFRNPAVAVHLAPGSSDVTVALPLDHIPASVYQTGIKVADEELDIVLDVPASRFAAVGDSSQYTPGAKPLDFSLKASGSGFEPGGNILEAALPSEGPPEPGMGALKISFRLPPGQARLDLSATAPAAIPGEPKALGLWIHGDGSGALPYLSFVDSSGQSFEEGGGPLSWKGWRYVLVFIDAPQASHSGGANDGVIHYPIRWDSLLTLRNGTDKESSGTLYLTGPTLIYGPVSEKSSE